MRAIVVSWSTSQHSPSHHTAREGHADAAKCVLAVHGEHGGCGSSVTRAEALPVTLPPGRLAGLLDRTRTPAARLAVALTALHATQSAELRAVLMTDLDLPNARLSIRRRTGLHFIYLDELTLVRLGAGTTSPFGITQCLSRRPTGPFASMCRPDSAPGLPASGPEMGVALVEGDA